MVILLRQSHQRFGKILECFSDTVRPQRALFGQDCGPACFAGFAQFRLQWELCEQWHFIAEAVGQLFGYACAATFAEDT